MRSSKRQSIKVQPQIISWRRYFHEHPELGNLEFKTADTIAKILRSFGLEVKTGIAKTGVVAILQGTKPGPVIALRADMDALPVTERTPVPFASKVKTMYNGQEAGVMHACGHDSHMAMLLGTAEILSSMKAQIKGVVKFIFQPAEEGVGPGEEGGAELMVKEGVLLNPKVDVIFGLHIQSQIETGTIAYRPGGTMAGVNDVKIIVKGKSSHGAYPWNAIDPIVISAEIVNNLQTIISRNLNLTENPGVVSIGSVNGGNRSNIIPEKVELWGTLRAMNKSDEALIISRVKEIATKTAESGGATAEVLIPYSSHYPVTYNDSALVARNAAFPAGSGRQIKCCTKTADYGSRRFFFLSGKDPWFLFLSWRHAKGRRSTESSTPPYGRFFY